MILQVLQLAAEALELARLGRVGERDERLERRLEVEPLVLVDLVRTDRRLDRRVELHPRDVARVVVVAHEGVGALLEERFQRGLRRRGRGFAQQARHLGQLALILEGVGHRRQLAVRRAANRREEAGRDRGVLSVGQRLHPRDRSPRAWHPQDRSCRPAAFSRTPGRNRPVLVELRPGSLVQQEVAQARTPGRRRIRQQLAAASIRCPASAGAGRARRCSARPRSAARARRAPRRQIGNVDAHLHRREARLHRLELGGVGQGPSVRRGGGSASKRAERGDHGGRETHRNLGFSGL